MTTLHSRVLYRSVAALLGLLPAGGIAMAAEAGATIYLGAIKPALKERCYACHGALKQKAGLRLDTAERIRAGGDAGAIVTPGDPASSALIARVLHGDPDERMPPEGKPLDGETLAALNDWIAGGAPVPDDERGDDDPRDHWAFQRIERPELPATDHPNPIDALLGVRHAERGLRPAEAVERPLLVRRLYLDLVGLPPTAGQLSDARAVGEIADELLASPHHGERWGRHWMDVWRYSDWYGLNDQLRYSQKHLWHWREWIVDSLNADKGYDRMLLEMLAGDELAPDDVEAVTATGFLARNYYLFNRTTWLDSTIEHTGKAFLGLTLNCAKCHDHKYDPITHLDYYRFRAIFEPHRVRLDPVPGETDLDRDGLPRAFDGDPDTPTYLHRRGDPADPDTDAIIAPGVPAILASFAPGPEPVPLPATAHTPGLRDHVRRDQIVAAERALAEASESLPEAGDEGFGPTVDSDLRLEEGFDALDTRRWEIVGDDWAAEGGALVKTKAGRDHTLARLLPIPPHDFEVSLDFTTTGGSTYKSVGVRFDLSEDGGDYHQVYASAHAPGPKLQVAHSTDGKSDYPPSGKVSRQVAVGQAHTLKLLVRNRLLNVWFDGEFQLAYLLPDRRQGGQIGLMAFDATATFDAFSLRPLSTDASLARPKNGADIALAEAAVEWRRSQLAAVRAVASADGARHGGNGDATALARAAARAQAEKRVAEAAYDVAAATKPDARTKAGERLAAARAALAAWPEEGGGDYAPLRVSRQALNTPEDTFDTYPASYPDESTGRRLALARWIVHRENPLAARVAVTHVWLRHFGSPLVETVFDFGRRAPRPEHAALLDWLAAEFIESGWSLKQLHRLMVTSDAYSRSSSNADADPATLAADPENTYYWRANPRRMESQVVRDSLLHLAGRLDLTVGGPSIDPADGGTRRSLYFQHSRDQQDRFLGMFDDADHLQCYRRTESIVPQQALALANAKLALEAAAGIAATLPTGDEAFVTAAFQLVLGRRADRAEREACREFATGFAALQADRDTPGRIRAQLVHALLNHNDFVTIR